MTQVAGSTAVSRFLATPLLKNGVVPFLEAQPLPVKQDPLWGFNDRFVPDRMLPVLDRAHVLTERLYALLPLSVVSKAFRGESENARKELKERIVVEITLIHEGNRGSKTLRELVDAGGYHRALRVYFFVKPQALHNFVSDKTRQEGFTRNILHNAAAPDYGHSRISEPFVAFVLAMDLQHNLGLSKQQDCYQRTPLEFCRKRIELHRNAPEGLAIFQRIEQKLVEHEARIVPTPILPPVPKVQSFAPQALELPASPPALAEPLPAPVAKEEQSPSLLCQFCSACYDAFARLFNWIRNLI